MSRRLFDLTGRVALVTGGSKGLGKAMARGFAEAGADVVISSRHEDELRAAAGEIRDGTGRAGGPCRRRHDASRRRAATRRRGRSRRWAGSTSWSTTPAAIIPQPIDEIRDEDWDRLVELNLSSCMALTRALVGPMKERKWGRIIHISSIMGLTSAAGRSAYSATKSALTGLARAGANDLGGDGITVNCIAPGPFLTDLPASLLTEEQQANFARRTALGRWGDPRSWWARPSCWRARRAATSPAPRWSWTAAPW